MLGYNFSRYFAGVETKDYFIDQSHSWTDLRGVLQLYIPKGVPVTLSDLEKKNAAKFDFCFEVDGPGQYHVFKKKSPCLHFLWSQDIYRVDKSKFHRWL